jgi:hypothetical protein
MLRVRGEVSAGTVAGHPSGRTPGHTGALLTGLSRRTGLEEKVIAARVASRDVLTVRADRRPWFTSGGDAGPVDTHLVGAAGVAARTRDHGVAPILGGLGVVRIRDLEASVIAHLDVRGGAVRVGARRDL